MRTTGTRESELHAHDECREECGVSFWRRMYERGKEERERGDDQNDDDENARV